MKLLIFYSCLFATLLQAIFASTSSNGGDAALKSKKSGCSKTKKATGRLVWKRKSPVMPLKRKRADKHDKDSLVVKDDKPKSLIELLPKTLVEIVIDYFKDDIRYSIFVSTHSWLFKSKSQIAVDSARLYVMIELEGLKGLNHSSANLEEDERHFIEFSDPQWSTYYGFASSHDGRYVFFSHGYKASTDYEKRPRRNAKWFTQDNELEGRRFTPIAFDDLNLPWGRLSRDGQTLFSYGVEEDHFARVYQIMKEAGKSPTAFRKFELSGKCRAISGKGNRIMIAHAKGLEIHEINKTASKLVCRISRTGLIHIGALNEDGSEAAFVDCIDQLRVMEVGAIVGGNIEQPAIVTVNVPKSLGEITKLVYSDGNKLHVLHKGGSVSLFDPAKKTLIPIEIPEEGHYITGEAISPNADYIATIQRIGKEEKSEKAIYRTIVKRKPTKADLMNFFGYKAENGKTVLSTRRVH